MSELEEWIGTNDWLVDMVDMKGWYEVIEYIQPEEIQDLQVAELWKQASDIYSSLDKLKNEIVAIIGEP